MIYRIMHKWKDGNNATTQSHFNFIIIKQPIEILMQPVVNQYKMLNYRVEYSNNKTASLWIKLRIKHNR